MQIDNPNRDIKVIEWISATKKKIHTVSDVFQDDKIKVAIQKISNFFKENIYAWSIDELYSIEFTTSLQIPHINPFKISSIPKKAPKAFTHDIRTGLFMLDEINIVRRSKLPTTIDHRYYFYKESDSIQNIEQNLIDLSKEDPSKVASTVITRFSMSGVIDMTHSIKYIYENLTDTHTGVDCAVWVFDTLNKKYNIVSDWREKEIPLELIEDTPYRSECLLLINKINKTKGYYVVKIDNEGNIILNIYTSIRQRYSIDNIATLVKSIKDIIKNITGYKDDILLYENYIKSQVAINSPNFDMKHFKKQLTGFKNFVVVNSNQHNIMTYKRTSIDDSVDMDEGTYIQNMLDQGLSVSEILQRLKDQYGDSKSDEELIDIIHNLGDTDNDNTQTGKRVKLVKDKAMFKISYNNETNLVVFDIENIPNIIELGFMIFWMSRLCNSTRVFSPKKQSSKSSSKSSSDNSFTYENVNVQENNNNDTMNSNSSLSSIGSLQSSDSIQGGGRKQIVILQNLDQNMFANNYARHCMNTRQPMGMKNEAFQKYIDRVDNHIVVGNNTYFCPRWWCPDSEIPLKDPTKEKCIIKDEKPINLYEKHTTALKDPNVPKNVKMNNKHNQPCCYTKENEDKIKENSTSKVDKTNYILTLSEHVPQGRYGKLPDEILQFFGDKNMSGTQCAVTIKNTLCAFRKGISLDPYERDIVDVLGNLLEKTRKQFINDIINKIDIIDFITLENGEVLREFVKITIKNNSVKSFKATDYIPNIVNFPEEIKRLLLKALFNYLKFLKNSNIRSPHYLYSIVSIVFEKIMYVWKHRNNVSHMICPMFSSYTDIEIMTGKSESEQSSLFVLDNNDVYEPIVMKSKLTEVSKLPNTSIQLQHLNKVRNLCTTNQNIHALNSVKSYVAFNKNKKYSINTILLNSDLTVNTLQLQNNIYIVLFDSISPIALKELIAVTKCSSVVMYDDQILNKTNFSSSQEDIDEQILNKTNFSSTQEDIDEQTLAKLAELKFKVSKELHFQYLENSILFCNSYNLISEKANSRKLLEMAKYIYLNADIRNKDWRKELFTKFTKEHKNKLSQQDFAKFNIMLEEQEQYSDNVKKWYDSINVYNNFMSTDIQENHDGTRIEFSNKALSELLQDRKKSRIVTFRLDKNTETSDLDDQLSDIDLVKGNRVDLPSKWKVHKLTYVNSMDYDNNKSLYTLFEKLKTITKYNNSLNDVKKRRDNNIYLLMGSKIGIEQMIFVLNYKDIFIELLKTNNTITNQQLVDKIYTNRNKLLDTDKLIEKLHAGHYDIQACADLLNVVFIIIRHRAVHDTIKPTKRGSVSNLMATCDVYIYDHTSYLSQPLVVLFVDYSRYYFVEYFKQMDEAPKFLKDIADLKIKQEQEK